jgi:hypothetical protein
MTNKFVHDEPTKIEIAAEYRDGEEVQPFDSYWVYAKYVKMPSVDDWDLARILNQDQLFNFVVGSLLKLTEEELEDYTMAVLEGRQRVRVLEK